MCQPDAAEAGQMGLRWELRGDRLCGHDWPGEFGPAFVGWELDELEVGARAAYALDDPDLDQWWFELYAPRAVGPDGLDNRGWPGVEF